MGCGSSKDVMTKIEDQVWKSIKFAKPCIGEEDRQSDSNKQGVGAEAKWITDE